jgi:hypothetical protein
MGFFSDFLSNPIAAVTNPISEVIGTSGNTGPKQGVLANLVADPVNTVTNTVSSAVQNPAKAFNDYWSSGGRDAATLAALAAAAVATGGVSLGAGTAGAAGAGAADLAAYDAIAGLTAGGGAGMTAAQQAAAAAAAAGAMGGGAAAPAAAAAAGGLAQYATPAAIAASSLLGANASQNAANTQANAAAQANQLLAQQYQQQRADLAPFTTAGLGAQNQLLTFLGLPGGTQGANFGKYSGDFTGADLLANQDPGYAFRLSEGQKALERSAAARGGLLSGGTGKALTNFGQQMGSQEYQNAYNRYQTNRSNQLAPLFTLTGSGQASAAGQAAAAGNYGAGAAGNLTSAGAAQAAGDVGAANAVSSGLSSYLGYTGQQNLINALRKSAYA